MIQNKRKSCCDGVFACAAAVLVAQAAPAQTFAPIEASLPATAEARAQHRECMTRNARVLSLLSASKEVVRTRELLRTDREHGRNIAFREGELDRSWKYYRSQGGTAAKPDDVTVPDDPCKTSADKVRQQTETANAQYRECARARSREIQLYHAANGVIQARQWLMASERMQEERRRNPNLDTRGSGEWAILAKLQPAQMRKDLEQRFAEYKTAGGPAARAEDVTALPDPCVRQPRSAEPATVRRQVIVIPERK